MAALLGSSGSTYDIRKAMDSGGVVLCGRAGIRDKNRFLTNFFIRASCGRSCPYSGGTTPSRARFLNARDRHEVRAP